MVHLQILLTEQSRTFQAGMLREKVMKLNIDHLQFLCKPHNELCVNQKPKGLFGSHLCFAELILERS